MEKLRKHFNLYGKYKFEISDLIALIYISCVVGIMCGLNMTPLFLCGCIVSLFSVIKAQKINVILINIAFVILNGYYLVQMFI